MTVVNLAELTPQDLNNLQGSISESNPQSLQPKEILKALAKMELIRREKIPEETLLLWLNKFSEAGYTQDEILKN